MPVSTPGMTREEIPRGVLKRRCGIGKTPLLPRACATAAGPANMGALPEHFLA
jgi:hypothetical protein